MTTIEYDNDQLMLEQVPVAEIAAQYGTPCYAYSRAAIERQWQAFDRGFGAQDHLICYAVKANSNLAILSLLARLGSGFDVVSGGELQRVLTAGGDPSKVVFSGVGKTRAEMALGLNASIACFNVESVSELVHLNEVAGELSILAPVSIRVNPDVDAKTHPYISTGLKENKFGIDIQQALNVYRQAAALPHLSIIGIDCHIGSQLTDMAPVLDAARRVLTLVDQLAEAGIELQHIDLGGGLGICYEDESPPDPAAYVQALQTVIGDCRQTIVLEPGRSIVGNAGMLITRVEYLKSGQDRQFAIVDAAMNDLMRPSLYGAWQRIVPVVKNSALQPAEYDIVGPICETGDFLGKSRSLAIEEGSLLAVQSAGAYGFTMSSNYNTRPRAAEVLVDGDQIRVIRQRETFNDLIRGEQPL